MPQLENIEAIERRLWSAADLLRANSNHASNEYFMPVMGLVFLRHAYSRFLMVRQEIEAGLPSRGGVKRALTKDDFAQKSAIYLREEAQFDYLIKLPTDKSASEAIVAAMESIEQDYESLKGVLPKSEYQLLEDNVLRTLLNTLNPAELKKVSGDVFGRIYEYFLTQFADQKAHDGGEFFTPISLVSFIANVLEPQSGTVFDPACGSGGMFVQSARVAEQHHLIPAERLTFRGMEKNGTTVNLARMNLAVHGLEGDIKKAITYYEDPLDLLGKCDFVMANPPFNVDEVDEEQVKTDRRLPFGLPGVNKAKKVSNGNYLWISYFYSYLNETGRAGFVMSSQASSAGRDEATVRQKLIETGAVDIMVAVRSNFFYTRTVPCELWFLNRAKPETLQDKVLMIDARNIYRKVTRKIYDFSPEQLQNLLSIVWLYRGETDRFHALVDHYLARTVAEAAACFDGENEDLNSVPTFETALANLESEMKPLFDAQPEDAPAEIAWLEHTATTKQLAERAAALKTSIPKTAPGGSEGVEALQTLTDAARDLIKSIDHAAKSANQLADLAEKELDAKANPLWNNAKVARAKRTLEEARHAAVEQLKQVRYFHRQAHWLLERFPNGELCDVAGLVKVVDRAEIEKNDWSLTPGRYVGVAPEQVDDEFDFEETLRGIHEELQGLNDEAIELATAVARDLEKVLG